LAKGTASAATNKIFILKSLELHSSYGFGGAMDHPRCWFKRSPLVQAKLSILYFLSYFCNLGLLGKLPESCLINLWYTP
jgi:hypothetical protein